MLATTAAGMAAPLDLTAREALSGISGAISITAWLFLLVPQIYENYCNQSAEALSIAFLVVWFFGDITNLAGAIWDGLLPTVIAVAVYFCFIDAALLGQVVYYKLKYRSKSNATEDTTRPLLSEDGLVASERTSQQDDSAHSSHGTFATAPRRRSSATSSRRRSSVTQHLSSVPQDEVSGVRRWLWKMAALLGVAVVGVLGWTAAWQMGWWQPTLENGDDAQRILFAEILGYMSALLYLGARLPQILKNYKDKSCEGLSLLFFMLSMLGNVTYGTQILFHSTSSKYIVKNLPWLIGSLGTIAEDVIIFAQFQIYAPRDSPQSSAVALTD